MTEMPKIAPPKLIAYGVARTCCSRSGLRGCGMRS